MEVKQENDGPLGYPLHVACQYNCRDGDDVVIMKLMELFPEAVQHRRSSDGLYPLHLALVGHIRCNQTSNNVLMKIIEIFPEAVKKLTKSNGTALHLACTHKHSDKIITKLIEMYPLALQVKNDEGRSPIHCAIIGNQSSAVINRLLDSDPLGMQRRGKGYTCDVTPLHLACERNNEDAVKVLLQRSDFQINIRDSHGKTPLHYVCDDTIIELLLNHPNVDVNATDQMNDTPLHKFVRFDYYTDERHFDSKMQIKIVQKLLDHPFIIINQKNDDDETPLKGSIKASLAQLFENHMEYSNSALVAYENQIQCLLEVSHLLKEFTIKRRWQSYCYHLKNIIGDHL